jgi:hypothetical protein
MWRPHRTTIRSAGHLWTVDTPGYCGVALVAKDGVEMPGVDTTHHFTHLIETDASR